jgi:hypothetical protein
MVARTVEILKKPTKSTQKRWDSPYVYKTIKIIFVEDTSTFDITLTLKLMHSNKLRRRNLYRDTDSFSCDGKDKKQFLFYGIALYKSQKATKNLKQYGLVGLYKGILYKNICEHISVAQFLQFFTNLLTVLV